MSSCSACTQGGDNANPNKCPIKSDYNPFTDYRPRCAAVYQQTKDNKFASSYDTREYLIHNADELIKQNAQNAYIKMSCQCVEPFDIGTMLPELQKQTCTDRICTFDVNDKYGLGLGRVYYTPDQEQEFRGKFVQEKEKEQAYFKEQNFGGTANDKNYWPIDGTPVTHYDRYSSPSGGYQVGTQRNS
jgi:hypothetical protein